MGRDDYTNVRPIGSGSYGDCSLVERAQDGQFYVLKEIKIEGLSDQDKAKSFDEVQLVLRTVEKHPYIVRYCEAWNSRKSLFLVMEWCSGGDLKEKIEQQEGKLFSQSQTMDWMLQLTHAIDYLHGLKVLHRDIKTANVFLATDNTCRLGDFGIATEAQTQQLQYTLIGTPQNMAPEMWTESGYDTKCDIWALGCVLYEILTLRRAFTASSLEQLMVAAMKGHFEPLPERISSDLRGLVDELLHKDSIKRPSAKQILQKSFLQRHQQLMFKQQAATLGNYKTHGAPKAPLTPKVASQSNKEAEAQPDQGKEGQDAQEVDNYDTIEWGTVDSCDDYDLGQQTCDPGKLEELSMFLEDKIGDTAFGKIMELLDECMERESTAGNDSLIQKLYDALEGEVALMPYVIEYSQLRIDIYGALM